MKLRAELIWLIFAAALVADVPQCKVSSPVQRIQQWQHQRGRHEKNRRDEYQRSRKELQRVEQSPLTDQAKESADRLDRNFREPGLLRQQQFKPVARVAKIIVRLLMLFPFMRRDQQQASAGRERSRHFADHALRLRWTCSSVTT